MKILMHMCCAPCSTYPMKYFEEEVIEVEGLFYNPNIHPIEEHVRRRETVERLAAIKEMKVYYMDDFMQEVWENYQEGDKERCQMCYSIRLEKAASFAKKHNYDAFTTSLLVSPYQNHELIKELGEKYALKYGVQFYYYDFRPNFREGQNIAKELELYRQKYCGCIISYLNRLEK